MTIALIVGSDVKVGVGAHFEMRSVGHQSSIEEIFLVLVSAYIYGFVEWASIAYCGGQWTGSA